MNNALLNGLSGETLNNSFPVFQSPGQKKNDNAFSALLEKNLFSGLSSNEVTYQANKSFETNHSTERRGFEQNSFSLTRPKKLSDNRKIENEAGSYNKKNESLKINKKDIENKKDAEQVDKKQETKTNKSENNENFDEKVEAVKKELISLTGSEKKAEELIADLSDQELIALNEIIKNLDQNSLNALQSNPELLTDIIKEEISSLPDSPQKQKLLETLDSQELEKLTAKLAEIASANKKQNNQAQKETIESSEQVQNGTEAGIAGSSTNKRVNETNKSEEPKFNSNKSGNKKEQKADAALAEKLNSKSADNSETLENKNTKETLRQEFAKIKKAESEQSETTIQQRESSSDDTPAPGLTKNKTAFKPQTQEQAPDHTGAQVAVKKFVETLLNNKTAGSAKEASFTYSPQTKQGNRSSGFQNNSGSGFSNGFSSNSGANSSSIAGNKPASSPNNSVFLSQLIEKAEMLKTNDGKKVLSMKLDPKELGKMEMELTSRDGNLSARISAESELAKIKLEQLSLQIKEHLNEQGINLTEITVDISSRNPDERNRQQLSEGKNKSSRIEKVSKSNGEQIIKKNVLPNLRSVALNIQSVDLTV
ncbi:MAG: flagellar hook-length control protein FliK [Candidatus Rifleibacteriota bacterium]